MENATISISDSPAGGDSGRPDAGEQPRLRLVRGGQAGNEPAERTWDTPVAEENTPAGGSADGGSADGGSADNGLGDEPALVDAIRAGNLEAFAPLAARYMAPAYAISLSIMRNELDAEDAVQTALVRALERINQLRPGSPFGPWFYRVLRSTCLNLRRRENLRTHASISDVPAAAAPENTEPARQFEQSEARRKILDALAQLPEKQRTAVLMYDLEGYEHGAIATVLNVAVGTSRANLFHGRQALRRILAEMDDQDGN